jgi:hypothetical protein
LKFRKADTCSLTATSGNVALICESAAPATDQVPTFATITQLHLADPIHETKRLSRRPPICIGLTDSNHFERQAIDSSFQLNAAEPALIAAEWLRSCHNFVK